jgi:AcrR family transcriptional regulator
VVHDEQPRKPRSQRADAQRNRVHLLEAAAAVLRANPDAGVEEIARRAAVGIGTLYRHFPTRDALVWAAYSEEVDALAAAADRLLHDLPPDEALGEWMQRLVDFITAKRGLVAALRAVLDVGAPRFDDARAAVRDAAGRLLEAGAAAGTIRDDLTPTDLLRAVSGLCLDTESPAGIARSRTLVAIFFEGLKKPVA